MMETLYHFLGSESHLTAYQVVQLQPWWERLGEREKDALISAYDPQLPVCPPTEVMQ